MKKILVIGAGRSSSALIRYLLENSEEQNWQVIVGDMDIDLAQKKTNGFNNSCAIAFDVNNVTERKKEIAEADLVVSMLPATMHMSVAKDCLDFKKHLVTASYVSKEMKELDQEAKNNNLIFLNECGLDPGIDHMSAMQVIDDVKSKGGKFISFKSYCGGLVAPESNDNPWGYKFSWNPRNVVLAGQGGADYIENSKIKHLEYKRLFAEATTIQVNEMGEFDAYANRDSLSYRDPYGLNDIPTMLRGTLRAKGYCKAWNVLIQLGLTDDTNIIKEVDKLTYRELVESLILLEKHAEIDLEKRIHNSFLANEPDAEDILNKITWLGILDKKNIPLKSGTPAQILQELLERKWKLKENDKDMIVMQHEFIYNINGTEKKTTSSLVVKGEDQTYTAMAKTVGLPMAIAVKLILTDKINARGVAIPTTAKFYNPILKELEEHNAIFKHS